MRPSKMTRREPFFRSDPFRELDELTRRFSPFFGRQALAPQQEGEEKEAITVADWMPTVDITENKKAFKIKAELPEVDKEDVHVTLDNNVLTLQGERRYETEEEDEQYHRVERSYGKFVRRFTLPENVDENGIQAKFKNGMLYLTLPKATNGKDRTKRIEIA